MTGCVVVVEVLGGVLPRRGVAAADVAALEALAQGHPVVPLARQSLADRVRPRSRRRGSARGRRRSRPVRRRTTAAVRSSSRLCALMSSIDSSTSSSASTSATTSEATVPDVADLEHPGPLRLDHRQPDPGVELARRLLVGHGAEPLPGGEVALVEPLPDQVDDAVGVVVLELVERGAARPWTPAAAAWRGPGRPRPGRGPARRSRRASQGSDMPWMNSVPATTVNAISSSTSRCGCPRG